MYKKEIMDNGQLAISLEADFQNDTWTFEMLNPPMEVSAGRFVIIPEKSFQKHFKKTREAVPINENRLVSENNVKQQQKMLLQARYEELGRIEDFFPKGSNHQAALAIQQRMKKILEEIEKF